MWCISRLKTLFWGCALCCNTRLSRCSSSLCGSEGVSFPFIMVLFQHIHSRMWCLSRLKTLFWGCALCCNTSTGPSPVEVTPVCHAAAPLCVEVRVCPSHSLWFSFSIYMYCMWQDWFLRRRWPFWKQLWIKREWYFNKKCVKHVLEKAAIVCFLDVWRSILCSPNVFIPLFTDTWSLLCKEI